MDLRNAQQKAMNLSLINTALSADETLLERNLKQLSSFIQNCKSLLLQAQKCIREESYRDWGAASVNIWNAWNELYSIQKSSLNILPLAANSCTQTEVNPTPLKEREGVGEGTAIKYADECSDGSRNSKTTTRDYEKSRHDDPKLKQVICHLLISITELRKKTNFLMRKNLAAHQTARKAFVSVTEAYRSIYSFGCSEREKKMDSTRKPLHDALQVLSCYSEETLPDGVSQEEAGSQTDLLDVEKNRDIAPLTVRESQSKEVQKLQELVGQRDSKIKELCIDYDILKESSSKWHTQLQEARTNVERLRTESFAAEKIRQELVLRDQEIQRLSQQNENLFAQKESMKLERDGYFYKFEKLQASYDAVQRQMRLMSGAISRDTQSFQNLNDDKRPEKAITEFNSLFMNERIDAADALTDAGFSEDFAIGILCHTMVDAVNITQSEIQAIYGEVLPTCQTLLSLSEDENKKFLGDTEFFVKSFLKEKFSKVLLHHPATKLSSKIQHQFNLPQEILADERVKEFVQKTVRVAWLLCLQTPSMRLDTKVKVYDQHRHQLYADSRRPKARVMQIKHFVWPTLLSSVDEHQEKIVEKGVVQL